MTTEEGYNLGNNLIIERINDNKEQIIKNINVIPGKSLGFIIKRYLQNQLTFSTEKPFLTDWYSKWEDHILTDSRIWILYNRLFTILEDLGLCFKTHDYVSTRGGELRALCYVIPSEIQEFLTSIDLIDFKPNQEETLKLYTILLTSKAILSTEDKYYAREQLYELLKIHSLTENQLAGIVDDASKKKFTSEYRGLLSENKPFDIFDSSRFKIYLDKSLLEPAINILLEREDTIKEYNTKKEIPSLSEIKHVRGYLTFEELGNFYIQVSKLERQLRQFIQKKLGKGWMKMIENDISNVAEGWKEKKQKDDYWGIEPEEDLMNYADLWDYIHIIEKYNRMFSDRNDELGEIITQLKIWYNQGRNPVMHSRTVDDQKYYSTMSAIQYLHKWMDRK